MQGYKRFLIKALQHSHNKDHEGFVLPMMIGLGLIMTVVGLTMIGRSSDDQIRSTLEEQTAQALAAAETGITRVQALFLRFPELAERRLEDWETYFDIDNEKEKEKFERIAACNDSDFEDLKKEFNENLEKLLDDENFTVRSYEYDEGDNEGTLNVEGSIGDSRSRLQVNIPVRTNIDEIRKVGLWVRTFDPGENGGIADTNQKINSNVMSQDCQINKEYFNPDKNFPEGNPDGWRVLANPLQPFPDMPLEDPFNNEDVIDLDEGGGGSGEGEGNKSLTLPRDGDAPLPNDPKTYAYKASSLELQGSQGISVNTDECDPSEGCRVQIFVDGGNIEFRGTSGINGDPNALQIYGIGTQEVILRGNANVNAFVFAPEAEAGVAGGGGDGGFYGPLWVKTWQKVSGSNKTLVDPPQGFDWDLLPFEPEDFSTLKIQRATSWKRQQVNNDE